MQKIEGLSRGDVVELQERVGRISRIELVNQLPGLRRVAKERIGYSHIRQHVAAGGMFKSVSSLLTGGVNKTIPRVMKSLYRHDVGRRLGQAVLDAEIGALLEELAT